MKPEFDAGKPIYMQIIEHFRSLVVNGTLRPGERVLPVRELALEYGVNPNTMQRALSELERAGLLFSERTSGRCVTNDAAIIEKVRNEECRAVIGKFVEQMQKLGFSRDELIGILTEYLAHDNEEAIE